jgi:uncharacterized protein (TIGR03437 family)
MVKKRKLMSSDPKSRNHACRNPVQNPMGHSSAGNSYPIIFIFLAGFAARNLEAQQARITAAVDNRKLVPLSGHIHPAARSENDRGRVDASLNLEHVTLILKPSAAQEAELTGFLTQLQDPSSPNYRRWLTPEQYAARFGSAQSDIDKMVAWLASQHLTVLPVARARNAIPFTGNVRRIESAFHTEIHRYAVGSENHFANASDPSLPAAFGATVNAVHGLNDFRMRPPRRSSVSVPKTNYTSAGLCGSFCIAPDDLATLYDITPLYNAGISGSAQKVAIAGQTQINLSDIQQFRAVFNLPAIDPQPILVPNTRDPGISHSDLPEADLDIEWAGAVARNATILYYYSFDVFDALAYIIDQNAAPVVSTSYGDCESQIGNAGLISLQGFARQANAQGMTWISASGDSGADDCFVDSNRSVFGLSVDAPASVPEVTGIGGTELNEGSGNYWNATNNPNGASLIQYVPETTWNDSAIDGTPSASGGGASMFFPKPTWQTGTGVPADGARDVPDISLSASADHDGYLVYTGGSLQVFGGTSVGAPVFAGMLALLNQYLIANGIAASAGLGNVNPALYALAHSAPGAFHDVTSGNNIVNPCPQGARGCTAAPIGYNAAAGYDLATGIGSVDLYNLATAWPGAKSAGGSLTIQGLTNAASYKPAFAPGAIMAIFGTQLATATQSAAGVPLPARLGDTSVTINGIAAPLYFVSPGQLNVQIPYETPAGSNATLQVTSNGQSATSQFSVALTAPGIFADATGALAPNPAAARGQTITLFVTGEGAASPAPETGSTPVAATAPKPVQSVSLTVGGIPVATPFQFIGIPQWAIGLTQINFAVPANVALGVQPVVATVGGVSSAPANLTVTQ